MNIESQIASPPRTSKAGTRIVVALAAVYSVCALYPAARPAAVLLISALVVFAVILKQRELVLPTVLFALLTALPLLHPVFSLWPWGTLLPVLLVAVLSIPFPSLRSWRQWLRPGHIDARSWLVIGATLLVSGAALVVWERIAQPDLTHHLASMPALTGLLVPLAGLGFSVFNAALEEVLFRGAVMHAADSAFGPGWSAVAVQAWLFGAAHFLRGFPNGWWGLVLASIYGTMLGLLRRRSRGMTAPWLAHAGADMVIFTILAGHIAG